MDRLAGWMRGSVKVLFALLGIAVAAYAFLYLYRHHSAQDPFAAQFAVSGWDVPAHFFAAGLALLLAPLQLNGRLRARWPAVHRASGWVYTAAVLIGGVSGLSLAINAQGGLPSRSAFVLLSIAWLLTTALGIRHAVAGDIARHRRWMCRSVALTFAAVTLRLILGTGIGLLQLPPMPVYIASAWLSWTLNLAICELLLRYPRILEPGRPVRPAPVRTGAGDSRSGSRPAGV